MPAFFVCFFLKNFLSASTNRPFLRVLQIRALTSADIAAFLGRLSKKEISGAKANSLRKRGEPVPNLSPKTIKMIRDLLNVALNSAKMWGVIEKNPVCEIPRCTQLKKREARRQVKYERKIWAPEYMFAALKDMEETDPLLHLAVHLSFMSSSRGGETTAVTLDSIDFEKRTIQLDKTIKRIKFSAMDALPDDELIFVFPNKIPGSKSAMVLKRQKTPKSDRVFYMTEQLEANIRQRISYMEKAKEYFGDRYHGNILKSPEKACKINRFTKQIGTYYTTTTPFFQ